MERDGLSGSNRLGPAVSGDGLVCHLRSMTWKVRGREGENVPIVVGRDADRSWKYCRGMTYNIQIVVDAARPHELADWWAETLEWIVEPQDEAFIRSMIDQGFATEAETTQHRGALVWREAVAIHPDTEPAPDRLRILFQMVPETKTVKNRIHLDLRPPEGDPEAIRQRLVERGATILHTGQQGPHTWVTMADPEGNEFCV